VEKDSSPGNRGRIPFNSANSSLSIDNLLDTEVVLASGEIVRANSKENDDLFWALRGNCQSIMSYDEVLEQISALLRNSHSRLMTKRMFGRV
jgi:hypothetical protein